MSIHPPPQDDQSLVYIIDDEEPVRTALDGLLRSAGFAVRSYACTAEFQARERKNVPSCLLLDVRLRGESGLVFHQQHKATEPLPFIFMSGYADVRVCVKAMKAGAADFLVKPLADQELIDSVTTALSADRCRLQAAETRSELQRAYGTLTTREREVLGYVVGGAMNKQIAMRAGISEITVKVHRSAAMRKMNATSLADLVRKTALISIEPTLLTRLGD